MPVIARDAVASDHLVYAWPFPIGPEEHEVACAEDELVVMCPSWTVGDRLGPGRHRWRTPDPMRPASAYFVLTAAVEVSVDVMTSFMIPTTGQPVRLRASGSLQVRCMDPILLVAQFVGLPFDRVNEGVVRSVSRSIERMIARLLTRRVVMAGTPNAVTTPSMLPNIVEELVAYNPAAGAVFGVELVRFGHLSILADDGSRPWQQMVSPEWAGGSQPAMPANGDGRQGVPPAVPQAVDHSAETARTPAPPLQRPKRRTLTPAPVPVPAKRAQTQPGSDRGPVEASGEIVVKSKPAPGHKPGATVLGYVPAATASSTSPAPQQRVTKTPLPSVPRAGSQPSADITQQSPASDSNYAAPSAAPRGAILGIGMSHIGSEGVSSGVASGEIVAKIAPGARVLVPGPDGLMQSATVRQLLQGYYELEIGGSGETIWVPMNGVVPE